MIRKYLSRRTFFKGTLAAASLLVVGVWDKMVKTEVGSNKKGIIRIPFNRNKKVFFANDFIVVNDVNQTKVFSSHCTHLGCFIHEFKEGKFICPCHGSEFTLDGEAVKGPAYKPLERMDFEFDDNKEHLIING
jgi:Rieske Fe-S protein